jgi:hypothetical protein
MCLRIFGTKLIPPTLLLPHFTTTSLYYYLTLLLPHFTTSCAAAFESSVRMLSAPPPPPTHTHTDSMSQRSWADDDIKNDIDALIQKVGQNVEQVLLMCC